MSGLSLDQYVVDVLMPDLVGHDRSPSAFIVYVYLWRMASHRGRVSASYATIAADTGLSKASAQRAVALLKRRKLVAATKSSATSVPEYRVARPWVGRLPQ
ncbi:MAG: helix-turn-helix domain-containing protein [Bacillota bacterium]